MKTSRHTIAPLLGNACCRRRKGCIWGLPGQQKQIETGRRTIARRIWRSDHQHANNGFGSGQRGAVNADFEGDRAPLNQPSRFGSRGQEGYGEWRHKITRTDTLSRRRAEPQPWLSWPGAAALGLDEVMMALQTPQLFFRLVNHENGRSRRILSRRWPLSSDAPTCGARGDLVDDPKRSDRG